MLRRQQPVSDKANQLFQDGPLNPHRQPPHRISNLTPYLTEIEKRKKQRSYLQRSKKNVNESSSKSFRIKDRSVTSLKQEILNRRQAIKKMQAPIKNIDLKQQKKRRTQSVNRHHEIELMRTIQGRDAPTPNNFFNDLYSKVRNKVQLNNKESRPLRSRQFQTLEDRRACSQQTGELNMYKISYTNTVNPLSASAQEEKIEEKAAQPSKRKNFRRNKYEAASQEVERTDNNLDASINLEMDKLAARQNQPLIQARNRDLHGSIEKSTEKYFNFQSYRPISSKNEIEFYVSSVPNPSLHKASHSTNEKSDCQNRLAVSLQAKPETTQLLSYDFDFNNDEEEGEADLEESDAEPSFVLVNKDDQFERQRKKVELQFFHKDEPKLDWSEDQCKVDDI